MPTHPTPYPVPPLATDLVESVGDVTAQRGEIDQLVQRLTQRRPDSVYLVGCGGSLFSFVMPEVMLDSVPVPVFRMNSKELVLRRPRLLTENSLVIVGSSNGATAETVEAARVAGQLGASVVGITKDAGTEVAAACPNVLTHNGVEAKQVLLVLLAASLVEYLGGDTAPYKSLLESLDRIPAAFVSGLDQKEDELAEIARQAHNEPVIYVLSSGLLGGSAHTFAECYLQEMQWMHAAAISSGEFLHGAFETVTDDVRVVVVTSNHNTRPMDERAIAFLNRYSRKTTVIDGATLQLDGLDEDATALTQSMIVNTSLVRRLAQHFESQTGHPMTDRRYMWKVAY